MAEAVTCSPPPTGVGDNGGEELAVEEDECFSAQCSVVEGPTTQVGIFSIPNPPLIHQPRALTSHRAHKLQWTAAANVVVRAQVFLVRPLLPPQTREIIIMSGHTLISSSSAGGPEWGREHGQVSINSID